MPKIILNGIEYSGNMTIQYNNPAIYSTDEREIGVWKNGKPLYRKTYAINSQASNIPTNIISDLPIHNCVKIYLIANDANKWFNYWFIRWNSTSKLIELDLSYTPQQGSMWTDSLVIEYTKTTDTPGSGTWGTNGCFTEHYSTSEQIVGTWIDGRPIYQKTIPFTGTYNVAAQTYIPHGITNLDLVLKLVGTCKRGNKRIALPFLHHTTDDWSINIYDADASTGNVTLWVGTNNSTNVTDISITMQYVKTTT